MIMKIWKGFLILVVIGILFMIWGCSTMASDGKLPDSIPNTTSAVMDTWCKPVILKNMRRIVLRVIHVVDPQWETVCVEYEREDA